MPSNKQQVSKDTHSSHTPTPAIQQCIRAATLHEPVLANMSISTATNQCDGDSGRDSGRDSRNPLKDSWRAPITPFESLSAPSAPSGPTVLMPVALLLRRASLGPYYILVRTRTSHKLRQPCNVFTVAEWFKSERKVRAALANVSLTVCCCAGRIESCEEHDASMGKPQGFNGHAAGTQ
jgi:hypothetical protein